MCNEKRNCILKLNRRLKSCRHFGVTMYKKHCISSVSVMLRGINLRVRMRGSGAILAPLRARTAEVVGPTNNMNYLCVTACIKHLRIHV